MGIHYTFRNEKPRKAMEKQARRAKKLAEKKAKRESKKGQKKDIEVEKKLDESIPIDLNFLTLPDKK